MKKVLQLLLIASCIVGVFNSAYAAKVPEQYVIKNTEEIKESAALCSSGSGFEMLAINNVRARVNTSGDMWQNFATHIAQYFIPANTQKTSLYSGALWIGGVDKNNQLKLAAQRFRQEGVDYWPGPLTIETASITAETCAKWDRMFHMSKAEVAEFIGWYNSTNQAEEFPSYTGPSDAIRNWPAHPDDPGQAFYLAPFFDANGDGVYNWEDGDYPYYDFDNVLCPLNYVGIKGWKPAPTMGSADGFYGPDSVWKPNPYKTENNGILVDQILKGDETYWWVFNDKGNAHTETKGQPIGLEIRAQAFAFATNDEINNMTFYSYEIINRSTFTLTNTYFAPWTDPDLGYAKDDCVGCDVERGMGYCYNGYAVDGTGQVEAYGAHPPAVGIDFFQGPYLDPNGYDNPKYKGPNLGGPSFDGDCQIVSMHDQIVERNFWYIDPVTKEKYDSVALFLVKAEAINGVNFGNGIVDDERFGMRRFLYHNNESPISDTQDPRVASDYYNYLRGFWKNGQRMRFDGKDAYSGDGPEADFMYPGDSDPCNWGTMGVVPPVSNWTDLSAGNEPGDRRFVQSAGPFTLHPGAVNYITFGVPWARDMSGDNWSAVIKLREADDKCQALFDNCFKLLDGPNAPDLYFVELDQKLIIHLRNDSKSSNNQNESYQEIDNTIIQGDSLYRFEGYQIYQLADGAVGPDDLDNVSKARLIKQFDVANGVGRIVNFEPCPITGFDKPVLRVDGEDKGISHSFEVTIDAFATGQNRTLVNNKQYYFMAIAYAYNNWKAFDPSNSAEGGQRFPYLAGRTAAGNKKLAPKIAIPHKTIKGVVMRSNYGDMPPITRIEGQGNSSNWLELSDKTRNEILAKPPIPKNGSVKFGHPDYPIAYEIEYKPNAGPLAVKVIDPLKVVAKDYLFKFIGSSCTQKFNPMISINPMPDKTFSYYIDKAEWLLFDARTGDTLKSDGINIPLKIERGDTIAQVYYATNYEQLYPDYGISIVISQTFHPGDYWVRNSGNGFIGFSATFADSTKRWLTGIPDMDIPRSPMNWIRSGTYFETGYGSSKLAADYDMMITDSSARGYLAAWDPKEDYEKIFGRTWAPYTLCATLGVGSFKSEKENPLNNESRYGPAISRDDKNMNFMTSIGSVDIVFTPNKALWTRSMVLEMGAVFQRNEGQAEAFTPRAGRSIDKNGKTAAPGDVTASTDPNHPNYISPTGMSWFPGYAINVDTGERLNIIFGENSSFSAQNGRDMRFNPTNVIVDNNDNYYMGGQHYVYIMGHKVIYHNPGMSKHPSNPQEFPAYDAGETFWKVFGYERTSPGDAPPEVVIGKYGRQYIMASCMYVGMPIPAYGSENMFDYWITGEEKYKIDTVGSAFTLKIRVAKPFARYASEIWENPGARAQFDPKGENPTAEYKMPIDEYYKEKGLVNDNWPMYTFSTKGMEPHIDLEKLKTDVDLISVTPNPYYAYSSYERNALDNRVRFGNLPSNCIISIYNIGGTLIRQFIVDNSEDSDHGGGNYKGNTLDWDLKNFAGVPIAGGTYLIHVKTPHGEKVIKWFGVIRTVDLTTF
ncbi:MAG: hypothetical protein FWF09_01165 [Bacteroidales bacterium]|nr:hypothetical protein [Bacteroidales bacterium]